MTKTTLLTLLSTMLMGTCALAESTSLTFSGECTAEIYQGASETKSFSVQEGEKVRLIFKTVGVDTLVYAELTPAGKAILSYNYFVQQALNETAGESSLEAAKPGDRLNLHTITYGGNPEIHCSGLVPLT